MVLENLEPKEVFRFFEEICQVPHGTFDTKRISDYCVAFAKERGLACIQDETNNIIISKPGTVGYENSEPVIIQGPGSGPEMVCSRYSTRSPANVRIRKIIMVPIILKNR